MFAWRAVFGAILVGGVAGLGFGVGERSAGAAKNCTVQQCVRMSSYWNGGGVVVIDPFTKENITYPNGSFAVHTNGTGYDNAKDGKFRDLKAFSNPWHHMNNGVFAKDTGQVELYIWSDFNANCNKVNGGYQSVMSVTNAGKLVSGPEASDRNNCLVKDD